MGRIFKIIFVVLFMVFIGLQFIEVERTNPPVTADLKAPLEIKQIFKVSCYDCHSNETIWPWYSKVAPFSWLIVKDVEKGRLELNFSEWEKLNYQQKGKNIKKIWEEINTDEMPPELYNYLHGSAKLDVIRKNVIRKWISNDEPKE